mmetsp:Transcript_98575/g.281804  ORF Transcript_98575/g.281804 Transcript_98575/m.281804 type:complete len:206 (+) Transcript_98575:232-849(+)
MPHRSPPSRRPGFASASSADLVTAVATSCSRIASWLCVLYSRSSRADTSLCSSSSKLTRNQSRVSFGEHNVSFARIAYITLLVCPNSSAIAARTSSVSAAMTSVRPSLIQNSLARPGFAKHVTLSPVNTPLKRLSEPSPQREYGRVSKVGSTSEPSATASARRRRHDAFESHAPSVPASPPALRTCAMAPAPVPVLPPLAMAIIS